ncbi:hypothetical protein U2718_028960 [Chlorogloeopsis sp. ULAP02]
MRCAGSPRCSTWRQLASGSPGCSDCRAGFADNLPVQTDNLSFKPARTVVSGEFLTTIYVPLLNLAQRYDRTHLLEI